MCLDISTGFPTITPPFFSFLPKKIYSKSLVCLTEWKYQSPGYPIKFSLSVSLYQGLANYALTHEPNLATCLFFNGLEAKKIFVLFCFIAFLNSYRNTYIIPLILPFGPQSLKYLRTPGAHPEKT